MASVPLIRDRLRGVFTEEQADVLAHVVVETHEGLVTSDDFRALTTVARELAEAQKRTETQVGELTEAQKRTETQVGELTEAQKRTETQVGELTEAQKRTETQVGELTEAQKRTETQVGELTEAQKRTETRVEELAEAQKRTEKQVGELTEAQKRTETQVGQLAEAQKRTEKQVGELTEAQKRTETQVGQLAEAQKRTETRMEELAEAQRGLAESQREFTVAQRELAASQKDLTDAMKDTRKQLGGLAQSVGYGLEAYAMERIPRILARQMPFVEEASGPEQIVSPSGAQDDIDVVVRGTLAGRQVVFLCETKTNISPREVRDFLVTADRVRPQIGCDDVRILYFAYRASPEARAAVAEVGGYLAFPHAILVHPSEAA